MRGEAWAGGEQKREPSPHILEARITWKKAALTIVTDSLFFASMSARVMAV